MERLFLSKDRQAYFMRTLKVDDRAEKFLMYAKFRLTMIRRDGFQLDVLPIRRSLSLCHALSKV